MTKSLKKYIHFILGQTVCQDFGKRSFWLRSANPEGISLGTDQGPVHKPNAAFKAWHPLHRGEFLIVLRGGDFIKFKESTFNKFQTGDFVYALSTLKHKITPSGSIQHPFYLFINRSYHENRYF